LPETLNPELTTTQLALLWAVQLHPLGAVTLTTPVALAAEKDWEVGEME
jgi:hypothetical protein